MSEPDDACELTQEITLELTQELRERGLEEDALEIEELAQEIVDLERPPGVFSRFGSALKGEAERQWRCAVEELAESKEAWRLIRERIEGGRKLTPAEADAVRAQIFDAIVTVPAGVLTAASYLIPVPGAMVVTPLLLERVGLMPSRWRESGILTRLARRSGHLREIGEIQAAERLDEVVRIVESRAEEREEAEQRTAMLRHWDVDEDGTLGEHEWAAYEAELDRMAAKVAGIGARRRWYLQLHGHVFGPVRWGDTDGADPALPVFVCLDGKGGWVLLSALRERAGF